MDVLCCGCFPGKSFSGTVSFASFIDGSVCATGHMTHAVVLLCSALLGWCSLRPFCSLEWHVVDGCARSDGAPTKSTCISSVLGHALSPEGQLVIMPLVVDEGQQPHVRVLAMVLQWFARGLSGLAFAKCRVLIEMDCFD